MATSLIDARTETEFNNVLSSTKVVVVHFWAPWCEPCKQLNQLLSVLAQDHQAAFVRVEAEEVTEVSTKYEISVVPLFLFFQHGKVVDKVEGADIAALTGKVNQYCLVAEKTAGDTNSVTGSIAAQPWLEKLAPTATDKALQRVKMLVNSSPVFLFMKGTPDAPRCGFSSRVVAALRKASTPFKHFDILSDEAVRQAAKVYSDWPSYPQLYIRGDLVGGCDIIEEMDASGELKAMLQTSTSGSTAETHSLEERIQGLIDSHELVLFMKGTPNAPRCGFSSKVVQALQSQGLQFGSFDILQDQQVREGLKKEWPTFPQLFAGGELVGGCDIVLELLQQGQLKSEIESQIAASKHRIQGSVH